MKLEMQYFCQLPLGWHVGSISGAHGLDDHLSPEIDFFSEMINCDAWEYAYWLFCLPNTCMHACEFALMSFV